MRPSQRNSVSDRRSHGVKEHLVEEVGQWPGVHCARALIEGEALQGYWFDRTRESAARRRGEVFGKYEYAIAETVVLDPLPCWSHLLVEEQRRRAASLVQAIDEHAAARREAAGIRPLGVTAILPQDPLRRPERIKKSPAPLVHAAPRRCASFSGRATPCSSPPTGAPRSV